MIQMLAIKAGAALVRNPRTILAVIVVALGVAAVGYHTYLRATIRGQAAEIDASRSFTAGLCGMVVPGWQPRREADLLRCEEAVRRTVATLEMARVANRRMTNTVSAVQAELAAWQEKHGVAERRVADYVVSVRHLAHEVAGAALREARLRELLEESPAARDWASTPVPSPAVVERLRVLTARVAGGADRGCADRASADAGTPADPAGGIAPGVCAAAAGGSPRVE